MRRALRAGAGMAVLGLIAAGVPAGAQAAAAQRCAAKPDRAEESRMVSLIDAERRAEPVRRLRGNARLARAGRVKSVRMARGAPFAHTRSPRAKARSGGQNLAMASDAAEAFEAMMGSPSHRANIMSRAWRLIGVGAARSCEGTVYFTVNFLGPTPRRARAARV